MDKKNIIRICFIVIGVFIVLAVIEIGIRALSNKVVEYSQQKEEEKKHEEIYNSAESKTEREVRAFGEVIINAIKNSDYKYIWGILDETYKKYKFKDDFNNLKEFVETNFQLGNSCNIANVRHSGNENHITLGVTSGDAYFSKYITIIGKNSNDFKFMFDEYSDLQIKKETATYSEITYANTFVYYVSGYEVYVLDITNTSQKETNITFNNIALVSSAGKKTYGSKPENLVLEPDETKTVELYFKSPGVWTSYLELDLIKDGENSKVNINYIEYKG